TRTRERTQRSLRQRIFYETARSLEIAGRIADKLAENGYADLNVEIHLDVGENGRTRDLIREVVGMVVGSGFDARIKPDSYGAMTVADKYTKCCGKTSPAGFPHKKPAMRQHCQHARPAAGFFHIPAEISPKTALDNVSRPLL